MRGLQAGGGDYGVGVDAHESFERSLNNSPEHRMIKAQFVQVKL